MHSFIKESLTFFGFHKNIENIKQHNNNTKCFLSRKYSY